MSPDTGHVRRGTKLQVAYFDQMREQLDDERTLADTISPGGEWIETGATRKHVLSYLGDFLFPPQRATAPVKTLSGVEVAVGEGLGDCGGAAPASVANPANSNGVRRGRARTMYCLPIRASVRSEPGAFARTARSSSGPRRTGRAPKTPA